MYEFLNLISKTTEADVLTKDYLTDLILTAVGFGRIIPSQMCPCVRVHLLASFRT